MHLPSGLELAVIAADDDYVLVQLSASDGMFAGTTELYGGDVVIEQLADGLHGYPAHAGEERDIAIGSRDPKFADGWAELRCRCADRSGHPLLEIAIEDKGRRPRTGPRSAVVVLACEAAALDRFAEALWKLEPRAGAVVVLPGARAAASLR